MNLTPLIPAMASVVAVAAAITDVRERRIPNRLTYSAMLAGLALQASVYGLRGLLLGLGGGLLFSGVFLLFYFIRAMGAGDVKLAAALGCIIGPAGSWQVMFFTAVAGGALAILVMVFTGRVKQTLRSTLAVVGFHALHGLRTHPVVNLDNPTPAAFLSAGWKRSASAAKCCTRSSAWGRWSRSCRTKRLRTFW